MKEFQVIEVNSLWMRISGRIWRLCYRLRAKILRMQGKALYRVLKTDRKPRIYRVEIR